MYHINLYMRQLKTMRVVKGKTVMTTEAAVDTFKDLNINIAMVVSDHVRIIMIQSVKKRLYLFFTFKRR